MAYQNVGGSIEATNILLSRGREERWHLVFVAEAWEGRKGERTSEAGYRSYSAPHSKIVLYVREDIRSQELGTIVTNQHWIAVNEIVTGQSKPPESVAGGDPWVRRGEL